MRGLPAKPRSLAGVGLVILSGCCFGTLAIFGKVAYRLGFSTPQLLTYRFAGAAVLMWMVAAVIRQPIPARRTLIGLGLMGAVGYAGQSGAYFSALHFIPASATALLLYTYPVAVTLVAAAFLGEMPTRNLLLGGALILIGVYLAERGMG